MKREQIRKRERVRRDEGRALYSDANGNPRFRNSVASYLDILGTKQAVTSMTNADLDKQIRLLDSLNRGLHDSAWEVEWQRMLTFSDSIALAVPIAQSTPLGMELGMVSASIGAYQFELACTGRFMRGGIALGDVYADYANITGPALVEAVDLETNVAVMPRVLVSADCLKVAIADGHASYGINSYQSEWNTSFMVDADGRAFVNYLSTVLDAEDNDVALAEDLLGRHRDAVSKALTEHSKPSRIREKYVWVSHYHNAFCALHRPAAGLQVTDPLNPLEALYPRPFRSLFDRDAPEASAP